jgi:hypothetical protein
MDLSWEPLTDESEVIAVCREKKPGEAEPTRNSTYKLVYITPRESTQVNASQYVSGGARFSESASSRLSVPPSWVFEAVPPTPNEKGEAPRKVLYVSGRSGAGKSYWIRAFVRNYAVLYPGNPMYLISSLKKDDTLDAVAKLERIDIDKLVASPPVDVDAWKDSLVVIDDVEGLDKAQQAAVQRVQDMIGTEGRHSRTTLIRASHHATDYNKTRLILKETHGYVIFPDGDQNGYMRLLTTYAGMNKKLADSVLDTTERWVYIHNTTPRFVMTPTSVALLPRKL